MSMLSSHKWQCIFMISIFISLGHSFPTTLKVNLEDFSNDEDDLSPDFDELTLHSDTAPTTQKPMDEQDALKYLKKYGYMEAEEESVLEGPVAMKDLSTMLNELQDFAGLNKTGVLDKETMELMNKPRCQLPDVVKSYSKFGKRFSARARWSKKALSYGVRGYPTKSWNLQDRGLVNSLISTAFKDWSDVADVTFIKKKYFSDIDVNFFSRNHGDSSDFDGQGKVLAHAFLPENGRLHFDNDERWSSKSYGGPNLRQVATHEVGHILGLGHSKVSDSVMFPYYKYRYNFKLQPDDVSGAVYLYGKSRKLEGNANDPPIPTTPRTYFSTINNWLYW